jgi:hypothetical protein
MLSAVGCASINQKIAHCEALKDDTTRAQMNSCSAHTGCNMILNLQTDCAKTKSFLSRLKESMAGRSTITNNDVFEANTPTLKPNEELKAKVLTVQNIIRESMHDPRNGSVTRKNLKGNDAYYEGGMNEGKMHGAGVVITSEGTMIRGQMKNGAVEGQGQVVKPNGVVTVGDYVDSGPQGNIATQGSDGAVLTGFRLGDGKWSGVSEFTLPSGAHQKDLLSSEGILIASGPFVGPGQVAPIPSASATPEPTAPPIAKRQEQNFAAAAAAAPPTQPTAKVSPASGSGASSGRVADEEKKSSAAPPPTQPTAKVSSGSGSGASSGRVCDTQCGMIVADSKCKQVKDNRENLSCTMKNGAMLPDTPALCAEAKALSGCVTQAEKEAAKTQEIPFTPSSYRQVLNARRYAGKSVCDLAMEEWDERGAGGKGRLREIWIKHNGMDGKLGRKQSELRIKIVELCAKDDAEFKKLASPNIKHLEDDKGTRGANCGGRLGNGGPEDARYDPYNGIRHRETELEHMNRMKNILRNRGCTPLTPESASDFDEYSTTIEQNGLAAVEWAKTVKVDNAAESARSESTEEQACAVSLKSLEKQFNAAQREIPEESVVVRSESVLWVAAESIAKIKAQCPQSATYQRQSAQLQTTYNETNRVCDAHASSPPCVPRLPGKEPAAPAPQVAAPLKPLQNKPPGDCNGKGENFKHCFKVACEKQGHTFSESVNDGDTCYTCDRGGSDQRTSCVSGFGSAR